MTNPTERPEERRLELQVSEPDPNRRCRGCEEAPIGQHTGPHDWERPEERDLLAAIEERHRPRTIQLRPDDGPEQEVCDQETRATSADGTFVPWPCDARTLTNEVKERDERITEKDRVNDALHGRARRAEDEWAKSRAEVKELREENARLQAQLQRVAKNYGWFDPDGPTRLEQMEGALRGAREHIDAALSGTKSNAWGYVRSEIHAARAALSPSDTERRVMYDDVLGAAPSDTEEVMTQTVNEPST